MSFPGDRLVPAPTSPTSKRDCTCTITRPRPGSSPQHGPVLAPTLAPGWMPIPSCPPNARRPRGGVDHNSHFGADWVGWLVLDWLWFGLKLFLTNFSLTNRAVSRRLSSGLASCLTGVVSPSHLCCYVPKKLRTKSYVRIVMPYNRDIRPMLFIMLARW